jgi:hypothetical protein
LASGARYKRTGPSNANDGALRYDLTQWNQAWFDRLRARVIACRDAGVYCQILLFNTYPVANSPNTTDGAFPMQSGNNINSFALTLTDYWTLNNATCTAYQDAFVQKVIDTVNDLPNVLYEIANEPGSGSLAWQTHMVSTIKTYQAGKPNQHLVVMTGFSLTDAELLASNADVISPQDPSFVSDGTKVVINDTDHSDYYVSLDGRRAARHAVAMPHRRHEPGFHGSVVRQLERAQLPRRHDHRRAGHLTRSGLGLDPQRHHRRHRLRGPPQLEVVHATGRPEWHWLLHRQPGSPVSRVPTRHRRLQRHTDGRILHLRMVRHGGAHHHRIGQLQRGRWRAIFHASER